MKRGCVKMPKINFNCMSTCCKAETTYIPGGEKDVPVSLMCCVKVWSKERTEGGITEETDKKLKNSPKSS